MSEFVKYFLKNKALTWLLLLLVLAGGTFAYVKMGKLEDAPFTIKQALVTTPYPGASPEEVRSQVTDILEESIQSLGELYYLKSENRAGLSKITVYVKKEIRADQMQQLWDKLRRKVSDVQSKLPAGAGPSTVSDDFGDVLGVFYGIYGDGYTNRELEEQAKKLKNELLKVNDVAKVELYGVMSPSIDVTVSPSTMAGKGITIEDIASAFENQNRIVDAGALQTGQNRLRINTTGSFTSTEEIRNMVITTRGGEYFTLGEIATVTEGYVTPAKNIMKMGSSPAIGIAISTVEDGNVVEMSEAVKTTIDKFRKTLPAGYEIKNIYDQGYESAKANDGFILNLIISVITVVAILLFFIGFKNGLIVGSGLVFSIFATLIYMVSNGIALQRMSLAAIIIAMGMLVDNAIVVFDSSLVNMQKGMRKRNAIIKSVCDTAMPLLAATVIAILTFMPVYLSPHITGELLSSLFIVIAVSLLASWVFAITQNTFFIQEFVRRPRPEEIKGELFNGKVYNIFRKVLGITISNKWIVIASMVVLLVLSVWGFGSIPKVFMPQLDKQYFTIDMWTPEGTRIEETERLAAQLTDSLLQYGDISEISSYIGQTPPRYYLANASFGPQPNYAQCLVKATSSKKARKLQKTLAADLPAKFPELFLRINKFELNTIPQALIEARFCGEDPAVLDSLTNEAIKIMKSNPYTINARNEWGNMAMMVNAAYDPVKSGKTGIGKSTAMLAVKSVGDGVRVGIYRDNEKKVPVLLKSDTETSADTDRFRDLYIWNGKNSAPLSQITGEIGTGWEWPLVKTYSRELSMSAMCDVAEGHTMSEVHSQIREQIENIKLPEGYSFFWDSQYKDQKEAMEALTKYFPLAIILLVVILVGLFGNFRQPAIIFCILPLSAIGITAGMKMTGFSFNFFAIAGWLGLLGMIIKNIIVLLDEMNNLKREGKDGRTAIIEATVSRTRPVLMAAATTICGMVPLLTDVVFGAMATVIIFGLTFATALTLFITPALCAAFYKIK